MNNQQYLKYLKQTKNLMNELHSRYPLSEDNPYYHIQKAHDQIYNNYMDDQINTYEIKAMEEMVSNYLKNMSIDVSVDGNKIGNAIVKEIVKGFR